MPADRNGPRETASDGLIRAREDVVVTSGLDRNDALTHYVKIVETEEIFELGEVEYSVWNAFKGGRSLAAAERAAVEHFGDDFRDGFRGLVAELAIRGLLEGAIPDDLLAEFASDPRARHVQLQHQIDPDDREDAWRVYRFPLFRDPNRPFSLLARWFGFMRHAVYPILAAAVLAALILIKHAAELSADFPTKRLSVYGLPHLLVTLLTIRLMRQVVLATAIRYYGARIRVFSFDLLLWFWPRFHVDKKGLLRLARTPQLWAHSAPAFTRLSFFAFGALGWWWFRGDGTAKSVWCLVLCQAGIIELILSALPIRRGGKNETYYWCCAYFEEPFLRERAVAALRDLFSRNSRLLDLPQIERTALVAYGFSMIASLLFMAYLIVSMFMAWTGQLRGAGFGLFLAICAVVGLWALIGRARRQQKAATVAARRERRRAGRAAPQLTPVAEP